MGIQTMGLQGSSGSSSNNGKHTQLQGPTRQNSIYSLTLDEVQNHLGDIGKPLSSMNLDELLKNVWTAEGGQSVALEDGAASENQTSLERQGSLSLNGALSKRTVNEVWRDIQQSKNGEQKRTQERQTTLGEMTLEDFLVQAGVVVESSPEKNGDNPGSGVDPTIGTQLPQQGQWMQYGQTQFSHPSQGMMGAYMPAQPLPPQMQMGTGPMMDLPYSDSQISLTSPLMETLSDPMYGGRKRVLPEDIIEKSVERRQKRMIKNRESAARSRARKQAYTNELEIKVSRLEEENERLKKRKELESMLPTAPPEPKFQLRRTSSAPY